MAELGGDPRLASEAVGIQSGGQGVFVWDLQGDDAIELGVPRPPHRAEGTLADAIEQLESADQPDLVDRQAVLHPLEAEGIAAVVTTNAAALEVARGDRMLAPRTDQVIRRRRRGHCRMFRVGRGPGSGLPQGFGRCQPGAKRSLVVAHGALSRSASAPAEDGPVLRLGVVRPTVVPARIRSVQGVGANPQTARPAGDRTRIHPTKVRGAVPTRTGASFRLVGAQVGLPGTHFVGL